MNSREQQQQQLNSSQSKCSSTGGSQTEKSIAYVEQELTEQIAYLNIISIQRRIFMAWKNSFFDTKRRISRIIIAMDFSEHQLLQNQFKKWKQFVQESKSDRANLFRTRVLSSRVALQWKNFVARNNLARLEKFFWRLHAGARVAQIERILIQRHNEREKNKVFQIMKGWQEQQFERQVNAQAMCIEIAKSKLKMKYFKLLKGFAKITREVEFMRSTALESRRYYLFKRFFGVWQGFSKRRAIARRNGRELLAIRAKKTKEQVLYEWVTASIYCFQARDFYEKNLLRRALTSLLSISSMKLCSKRRVDNSIEVRIVKKKKLILHEWWRWAERRRIRERKCEAYLVMVRQRQLELMFQAFKRELQRTMRKEKLIFLSMQHYQIRTTKLFFESWSEFVEDSQKYYLDNISAIRSSNKKIVSRAFAALHQFLLKIKQRRLCEFEIIESKKNRIEQFLFALMLKKQKGTAAKVQKSLDQINGLLIKNIVQQWRDISEYKNDQRQKIANKKSQKKNSCLQKIMTAWKRRSVNNRLKRTQNKQANFMIVNRMQQKCFSRLSKSWKDSKLGQIIEQKRQTRVIKNAFLIWRFLKLQEQQINSFWIGNLIQKSQLAFQGWKKIASKKAYYNISILQMKEKRDRKMLVLGWKIWNFFLRFKDEKEMYRISLHRYSLMHRCKVILRGLHNYLQKSHNNQRKGEILQKRSDYWKKMIVIRIMKEKAIEQLSALQVTKRFRRRWELKRSKKLFVSWAIITQQRCQSKQTTLYLQQQSVNQIKSQTFCNWKSYWIKKRQNKEKEEMAHYFIARSLARKGLQGFYENQRLRRKEVHVKGNLLANFILERRQREALCGWSEVYSDRLFERATQGMEKALTVRLAMRQFIRQSVRRLNLKKAMHQYVFTQMRKGFESFKYNQQKQRLKDNQKVVSELLGKRIAWKRMISKMNVSKQAKQKRMDLIGHRADTLIRSSFLALVNNYQFRITQKKVVDKYEGLRQFSRLKTCFDILRKNVDKSISEKVRMNKYTKRQNGQLKKRAFKEWRLGFFSRKIENRRQRVVQDKINVRLVRIAFSQLHQNINNSFEKKKLLQVSSQFYNKNMKRSVFNAWKWSLGDQNDYIEKSNKAFRHYITVLKEKALNQWRENCKSQAIEEDQNFESVIFRGEALRRKGFEGLRWNQSLMLCKRIVEEKCKLRMMSGYFSKWLRMQKKQKMGMHVIVHLSELISNVLIRKSFQRIYECARAKQIIIQVAEIYSKNLKLSFLEVFTKNIIMHRRLNRFTVSKENQLKQTAFFILSQYNTFKKRRHLRIVSVLSAIHNAVRFNIARNAFYAFKRNQYINRLKRNTVIRYATHLKFLSFFSFRKFVIRMRSKRMIEEMAIQHKKRLFLGEWKNLFLQDEGSRNNPKKKRYNYFEDDYQDESLVRFSGLQYKNVPVIRNNGAASYNRYTANQSQELYNNNRPLQSSTQNFHLYHQAQSPTANSMRPFPQNRQAQFVQQHLSLNQFNQSDPSIQQSNLLNTYQSVELNQLPQLTDQQQLAPKQQFIAPQYTNYTNFQQQSQPNPSGNYFEKQMNINTSVQRSGQGQGGLIQQYSSSAHSSGQQQQQQQVQYYSSDESNNNLWNTTSTRSVAAGIPSSVGVQNLQGTNSAALPFLSIDSFISNQLLQSLPIQNNQQQKQQQPILQSGVNLEVQSSEEKEMKALINNANEFKNYGSVDDNNSRGGNSLSNEHEMEVVHSFNLEDVSNPNSVNVQNQRLFNEKRYQQLDLEHIEENVEENSQSIINRSQIDQSRKTSLHKSGVKTITNKSNEDLTKSKQSNSKSKNNQQEQNDYYFVSSQLADESRQRQTTLEYFSGRNKKQE